MYLQSGLYKSWVLTLIPMISILAPMLPIIIHVISVISLVIDGKYSQIFMEILLGVKMQIVFLLNIQHLCIEVESKEDKIGSSENVKDIPIATHKFKSKEERDNIKWFNSYVYLLALDIPQFTFQVLNNQCIGFNNPESFYIQTISPIISFISIAKKIYTKRKRGPKEDLEQDWSKSLNESGDKNEISSDKPKPSSQNQIKKQKRE